MQRINDNGDYLYCSVDIEISFEEYYSSCEDYFNEHKDDILKSCAELEYDEYQTEKVLSHYQIHWGNSPVTWGKYT
jgi:hypothetical protein